MALKKPGERRSGQSANMPARLIFQPRFLIVSLILLLGTDIVSTTFLLHLRYLRLDNLFHFLGGAWVALFFFYAMRSGEIRGAEQLLENRFFAAIIAVSVAALVGVLWEFYEFSADALFGNPSYRALYNQLGVADTMSDLLFDLLGSFFGSLGLLALLRTKG